MALAPKLAALVEQLRTLSDDELRLVSQHLRAVGKDGLSSRAADSPEVDSLDWLLRAVRQHCVDAGLLAHSIPFKKHGAYAKWQEALGSVGPDLLRSVGNPSGPRLHRFSRIVASCYVDWLMRLHDRVSVNMILRNAPNLVQAIDTAFPGYLGSGMLQKIIDSGESRNETN